MLGKILGLTSEYTKCFLNIGFKNRERQPDAHVYLTSLNVDGTITFSDGEGNFSVIHKLDHEFNNLDSVVMYIYEQ